MILISITLLSDKYFIKFIILSETLFTIIIFLFSNKIFDVQFSEPIRGVASGQSAVFYDKNICLGGGIISKSA